MSRLLAIPCTLTCLHSAHCVNPLSTQDCLRKHTFRDIAIDVSQFMSQITFLTKSKTLWNTGMPDMAFLDYAAFAWIKNKDQYFLDVRLTHLKVDYTFLRDCAKNPIIEQDHRNIKRLTKPMMGFGSFNTARRTLSGIEAMSMIRKGQVKGLSRHTGKKVQDRL